MKFQHDRRQGGFSLIEIAIVLVIIGLMIGGVVKGQTMVKNSKIKRIATDTASVQGAINAYVDSYWMLPGDDSGAAGRWTTVTAAGNGNGSIADAFNSTTAGEESNALWAHLYCSELAKGTCVAAATAATLPNNPLGGTTGVADGSAAAELGLLTKVVCMSTIPADYAVIYDNQFDDGAGDTGNIRGSATGEAPGAGTATAYPTTSALRYICTGF